MNQKVQINKLMYSLFWCFTLVFLLIPSKGFSQTLLAGWDFQTTSNGGTAILATPNTQTVFNSNVGNGELYLNGTNGASSWSQTTELNAFGGTSANAGGTSGLSTSTGTPAALALLSGSSNSANGKSIVFRIDMTGYSNLVITYATQKTNTGFNSQLWEYSSNGTSWTSVGTAIVPPSSFASTFQTLSTITGLDNIATAYIRMTVSGSTGSGQNNRFDNFQFRATTNTTPTITGAATATAFTTTYGTPSTQQSFAVSGSDLTANLIATAPAGFEVSSDGISYGATASFAQTSGNASGTLRVRLKATASVSGSYNSQNIVLSSTGANPVNIATSSSGNIVSPATITITANNQNVAFGTPSATILSNGNFTANGFVNEEDSTVISGSVSYTTNYTDTTPAGTSGIVITPDTTLLLADNYTFSATDGTITITSSPTPTITSDLVFSSVYGTTASTYTITASESPISFSAVGLPEGLTLNVTNGEITGTPTAAPGDYNVTISATNGAGTGDSQILVYTILPKQLTVTGAIADAKVYDRTNVATISNSVLVGVFGSDDVSISNTGVFVTINASNGVSVNSTQVLLGTDASNYTLVLPIDLTADITPKELTISGAIAQNKSFDGNTNATILGTLSGVISPDVVTLNLSGTFASSAIGTNISVTSTSTIGGANSGNYLLTQPTGLTANITIPVVPLLQWNTAGNAGTETSEPSTNNEINVNSSNWNYGSSTVTPAGNGNRFGGSNWGQTTSIDTNKYLQFTLSPITGYMVTPTSLSFIWDRSSSGPNTLALRSSVDGFTNNIATISVTATSNTTTFSTINISGLTDLTGNTTFRLYGYGSTGTGGTGGFDTTTGGTQSNIVLNGYTTVAPAPVIAASGTLSALSTVYGTPSSETSFSVSGSYMQAGILVTPPSGYEVSLTSGSGFASSVIVGAAGTISSTPVYLRLSAVASVINSPYFGDIVLSSTNAESVSVATISSSVSSKELMVTGLTAENKVFDGTTSATLSGTASLQGIINSDVVSLDGTPVATFASSSVGNGIVVSVSGYSISGVDSANYYLTQPTLFADITSEPSPVISSLLNVSATYGVPASTYTITASESPSSFNATGLPLGFSVNTTNGEITGTPTGLPGVYQVTISATNAGGTGSAILNYTILAKELTLSGATADNKIYDKTNTATISGFTISGLVGSDDVIVSNTATFDSVDVANGISVTSTQTLSGADVAKYTLTLPTGLSANITPKSITITGAIAQNKPFDGNTNAIITGTLNGVISGDIVTLIGTGTFASSAVANGIAVTSNSTLGGANSGNYSLTQPTGLVANITPAAILQWNTNGNTGSETTEPSVYNNPNVAQANLTQGSITAAPNSNRFGGSGWFNTGNTSGGNTLSEAIAGNDYIQFVVTPNEGYTFTATSLAFIWDFSGSGPKSVALRSSVDGFTNDIGALINMSASTSAIKTIPITSLVNVSSTTTFRLYGFGATATGGTGGFDTNANQNNVILYGTTAELTGPTSSIISGSTSICQDDSAVISVAITGGTGPFTLVYSDGTNEFTELSYTSGSNIIVSPTESSSYSIVSITDALDFIGTGNSGVAEITILPNLQYYIDADNDGFGDALGTPLTSCFPIAGYVSNATDCNDANASINPGAVDICGDGIDNDCNGVIDNVGLPGGCIPVLTSVQGTQCGTTLATIDQYVYANAVPGGAQGYRFRVTKMVGGVPSTNPADVQTIDTFLRVFRITQLASYAFNTTYQVEVSIRRNNVWQPFYGTPCTVTTPATTTSIQSSQCGSTLTSMADVIYANGVPFSTGYRFRVTNVLTSQVQIVDRNIRDVRMNLLTSPAAEFNTTYTIEVAVRNTDGTYLPYGSACNVTTPSFPTTQIQTSQCDYNVTSNSEIIYADSFNGISGYRFKFVNGSFTYVLERLTRTFTLSMVPGIVSGDSYNVQVSVLINGVWGPYGKVCSLTAPGASTSRYTTTALPSTPSEVASEFKAVAYPNPFAENFKLKVTTDSQVAMQVRVYDMIGKLVEDRKVEATEMETFEVGSNYPSGVYNVIVSQGANTQTVRVVKR